MASIILLALLGWSIDQNASYFLTILVATHFATAAVIFLLYRSDWIRIISGILRSIRLRSVVVDAGAQLESRWPTESCIKAADPKVYRAVLDPGVLISGLISARGAPRSLLWLDGSFELFVCPVLLADLERVLPRAKFRPHVTARELRAYVALFQRLSSVEPNPEITV